MDLTTLLFGPTERSTFLFRLLIVCLSSMAFLASALSLESAVALVWVAYLCLAALLVLRKRPLGSRLSALAAAGDAAVVSVLVYLAPQGSPPLWPLYLLAFAAAAISGPPAVAIAAVVATLGWTAVSWTTGENTFLSLAWPAALVVSSALVVILLSGRWSVERRQRVAWQEAAHRARSLWTGDKPEEAARSVVESMVKVARAKHGWLLKIVPGDGSVVVARSRKAPGTPPPGEVILSALETAAGVVLSGDRWSADLGGAVAEAVALRSEWVLVGVAVLVWDALPPDSPTRRTAVRSLSAGAADALLAADQRASRAEELRLELALSRVGAELASTLDAAIAKEIVTEVVAGTLGAVAVMGSHGDRERGDAAPTRVIPLVDGGSMSVSREHSPLSEGELRWLDRLAEMYTSALRRCSEHANLRASEEWLRASLDAMPAPAILLGPDRSILFANRAYSAVFGAEVLPIGKLKLRPGAEEETVAGKPPRIFAACTASVGSSGQLVTVFREVTREREALRVKDELIAMAGHELRSPLTSISGYSQMMARQLSVVQRQIGQLDQLIGDFMEASSFDDARLSLDLVSIDLAELVQAAIERFAGSCPSRPIRVEMAEVPEISGDPTRLGQVLDNLLSNANKYSPDDRTEVVLRAELEEGHVLLCVQDHGLGIELEHLPLLFERFYRVRSEESQGVKGLGLGLSIVRDLVAAHGGTVWAESAGKNQGSTFCVRLPLNKDLLEGTARPSEPSLADG